MSEKKGWTSSLKGLFIESDERSGDAPGANDAGAAPGSNDAGAPDAAGAADAAALDAIAAATGGGSRAARAAGVAAGAGAAGLAPSGGDPAARRLPGGAPAGPLDFAAIYTAAGIGADEQERVTKAAELLHALPAGTEAARQIVEASLKAFGVPIEKILTAGDREIQALDAYAAADAADTRQVLDDSNRQIAEHEQEIQRIRQVMDQRVAAQQQVARGCAAGKLDLAQVLGFFGHPPQAPAAPPSPTPPPKPT